MFDYPHLEVLLAVEREANLEHAAKSLDVTKSALSQTLGILDYRMGAVTLDRKPMRPTQFGARLCRHHEQVALLEQKFFIDHQDLFDVGTPQPVQLRVAVSDNALASWLTDIICGADAGWADFQLDIDLMGPADIQRALAEQRLCGAVFGESEQHQGFTVHPLGTHRFHAVAAPDFVGQHFEDTVSVKSVAAAPCLTYGVDDGLFGKWLNLAFGSVSHIAPHILPSSHGIANACVDGTAWGLCSSLLIEKQLASGALVELVPAASLSEPLYWHAADHVADAVAPLTAALTSALKFCGPDPAGEGSSGCG